MQLALRCPANQKFRALDDDFLPGMLPAENDQFHVHDKLPTNNLGGAQPRPILLLYQEPSAASKRFLTVLRPSATILRPVIPGITGFCKGFGLTNLVVIQVVGIPGKAQSPIKGFKPHVGGAVDVYPNG